MQYNACNTGLLKKDNDIKKEDAMCKHNDWLRNLLLKHRETSSGVSTEVYWSNSFASSRSVYEFNEPKFIQNQALVKTLGEFYGLVTCATDKCWKDKQKKDDEDKIKYSKLDASKDVNAGYINIYNQKLLNWNRDVWFKICSNDMS